MRESQPQVTRKSQPLREAGLLAARKDGTRTLLRAEPEIESDPVVRAALEAGRALCDKDGSLADVPALVAQREETARRLFAHAEGGGTPVLQPSVDGAQLLPLLPMLAPLLPGRALAVDVGAGEGALLPLLSPLYDRVVAIDRSAARLARCGQLRERPRHPTCACARAAMRTRASSRRSRAQGHIDLVVGITRAPPRRAAAGGARGGGAPRAPRRTFDRRRSRPARRARRAPAPRGVATSGSASSRPRCARGSRRRASRPFTGLGVALGRDAAFAARRRARARPQLELSSPK